MTDTQNRKLRAGDNALKDEILLMLFLNTTQTA